MAKEIIPIFQSLPDLQQARAFSEPFMRGNDFLTVKGSRDYVPSEEDYIAGVASYLDDKDEECIGFSVTDNNQTPLANAQALVDGCSETFARFSNLRSRLDRVALNHDIEYGKNNIKKANLILMSSVMIFAPENRSNVTYLTVAKGIAVDIPLKNTKTFKDMNNTPDGLEKIRRRQAAMNEETGNPEVVEASRKAMLDADSEYHKVYGLCIGTLLLPEIVTVKRILDSTSVVNGFFKLPRKERRKLLNNEARNSKARYN